MGSNREGRSRVGPAGRVTKEEPKLYSTKAPASPNRLAGTGAQLREDSRLRSAGNSPIDGSLDAGSGHSPEADSVGQREAPKAVESVGRSQDTFLQCGLPGSARQLLHP